MRVFLFMCHPNEGGIFLYPMAQNVKQLMPSIININLNHIKHDLGF